MGGCSRERRVLVGVTAAAAEGGRQERKRRLAMGGGGSEGGATGRRDERTRCAGGDGQCGGVNEVGVVWRVYIGIGSV